MIRQDVKESLDRYVQYGIMPGGFLTAVLENDLFEAVGRADAYNLATLADICRYVYNDMPSSCWGAPEKVDRYVRALVEHLEGEL